MYRLETKNLVHIPGITIRPGLAWFRRRDLYQIYHSLSTFEYAISVIDLQEIVKIAFPAQGRKRYNL